MQAPTQLESTDYLRQRLTPQPGDRYYIHLADLRAALERVRSDPAQRILDYGSGGSPYRSLFGAPVYHRADLAGLAAIDFEFGADSKLPVANATYDLVLSTQVLEHVRDVSAYLGEAHRVLAPGGRLVLTTHGSFPDHACPYDYHRWTAEGLAEVVRHAGFNVTRVHKLSTGPRALLFLLSEHHSELLSSGWSAGSLYLRMLRAPFRWAPRWLDRFGDRVFGAHRVVEASTSAAAIYVGLMVEAVRP